jgi:hypothetical protein
MSDATTQADSSSSAKRCGIGRLGSWRTAFAAAAAANRDEQSNQHVGGDRMDIAIVSGQAGLLKHWL